MINDYEATMDMTTDAVPVASSTDSNDSVILTLNGLIEVCRDGQQGFKDAAEGIGHADLKTLFYSFSQQRAEFTGILQELVRSLGGTPANTGSFSGTLHRGWMDLKSAITGKNDAAILNECERGEDFAKEAYAGAFGKSLPSNLANVIAEQSHAILAAHNRIKELRDAEARKAKTAAPGV